MSVVDDEEHRVQYLFLDPVLDSESAVDALRAYLPSVDPRHLAAACSGERPLVIYDSQDPVTSAECFQYILEAVFDIGIKGRLVQYINGDEHREIRLGGYDAKA